MSEKYELIDNGKRRRLVVETVCVQCENPFWVRKSWLNTQKYCSRVCSSLASRSRVDVVCNHCFISFELKSSQLNKSKSGLYFCCREHKDLAQRNNGIPRKNYNLGKSSYREIAFREKAIKCESCGYDKYKEVLDVHHIDHNRKNNQINNLKILCPTCHVEEHFLQNTGRFAGNKK